MRGRFGTQPFLVEVENGGCRLSPQRNFSSAPLGNPVAPSSVTFGDSFPPRGSLRRWYTPATKYFLTYPPLPQNAHPNQGTYMGHETAQPPPRCAPPRQNQRASSERAIKKGVQGACPRPSFSPFLGRNGDPRRAGGAPGALRPEAPEKPRPPKGYAVPHRSPARDRAGTHAAGSTLRRSQRDRLSMTEGRGGNPALRTLQRSVTVLPVRRSPRALDSVNVQGPGAFLRKVGGHFLQGQEISL